MVPRQNGAAVPGKKRLAAYRAKRRFNETTEPSGDNPTAAGARYLIQKHDATRLHYDLRLELDGVLLSWAVTRGPSYDPKQKRLAVRTEDHPLDYGDFEGTILKGQYGGGTVMLWDEGQWAPIGDAAKGLKAGKLAFLLYGKKLHGKWALVRMRAKEREKRENWLLIKEQDELAGSHENLLEDETTSVKSGRSMHEIADAAPPKRSSKVAPPSFEAPALATLVDSPPAGKEWL
ncbi:MAG: ATP-dependent DNA ligase, partial [Alphaproteobacteria bacterium]|nr:ATP-dependent DNA ligase [Alphaproteobacteria bacterium]